MFWERLVGYLESHEPFCSRTLNSTNIQYSACKRSKGQRRQQGVRNIINNSSSYVAYEMVLFWATLFDKTYYCPQGCFASCLFTKSILGRFLIAAPCFWTLNTVPHHTFEQLRPTTKNPSWSVNLFQNLPYDDIAGYSGRKFTRIWFICVRATMHTVSWPTSHLHVEKCRISGVQNFKVFVPLIIL